MSRASKLRKEHASPNRLSEAFRRLLARVILAAFVGLISFSLDTKPVNAGIDDHLNEVMFTARVNELVEEIDADRKLAVLPIVPMRDSMVRLLRLRFNYGFPITEQQLDTIASFLDINSTSIRYPTLIILGTFGHRSLRYEDGIVKYYKFYYCLDKDPKRRPMLYRLGSPGKRIPVQCYKADLEQDRFECSSRQYCLSSEASMRSSGKRRLRELGCLGCNGRRVFNYGMIFMQPIAISLG